MILPHLDHSFQMGLVGEGPIVVYHTEEGVELFGYELANVDLEIFDGSSIARIGDRDLVIKVLGDYGYGLDDFGDHEILVPE